MSNLSDFNLDLSVCSNSESTSIFLREFYTTQIEISHKKIEQYGINATDSGFDLYCPSDVVIKPKEKILYDLCVAGKPYFPGGYYLYPRSSFGKTGLRLCNSVGIIDNQYRGTYKAWIENLGDSDFKISSGERYFQLCHPSLVSMKVNLVQSIDSNTFRGTGGFGSTGK
jgi:deoxyuridine 5'-triphosphate nucleotidohydrolase